MWKSVPDGHYRYGNFSSWAAKLTRNSLNQFQTFQKLIRLIFFLGGFFYYYYFYFYFRERFIGCQVFLIFLCRCATFRKREHVHDFLIPVFNDVKNFSCSKKRSPKKLGGPDRKVAAAAIRVEVWCGISRWRDAASGRKWRRRWSASIKSLGKFYVINESDLIISVAFSVFRISLKKMTGNPTQCNKSKNSELEIRLGRWRIWELSECMIWDRARDEFKEEGRDTCTVG